MDMTRAISYPNLLSLHPGVDAVLPLVSFCTTDSFSWHRDVRRGRGNDTRRSEATKSARLQLRLRRWTIINQACTVLLEVPTTLLGPVNQLFTMQVEFRANGAQFKRSSTCHVASHTLGLFQNAVCRVPSLKRGINIYHASRLLSD